VLGLLYVMVEHNERALKTQLERRVEQNALLFNAALAGELIAHDYSTLRETLQLMRNEGALAYAVLEDARGRRIVAAGWQDDQPLPAAAAEESRSPQDGGMLHVAVPIRYQRHDLGTLHYGIDTGFIDRTRSELLRRSALLAATGFLLSALLVLALGYRMMRRLGQVAAVTRRISEGQLAARVGEAERDEIGRLGQAVDSMARALEEKLREIHASEERLSFVIQSTTDGVWDWDVVRNQTYFSPRFRELLGYDDEAEFRLMFYFRTALHPDDRDRALNALENTLKRRGRFDETYRLRCKDGSYRWFRGRGSGAMGRGWQACRFAGSLSDISDPEGGRGSPAGKRGEALLLGARLLRRHLGLGPAARTNTHISPRFRELLGYSEPEDLPDEPLQLPRYLHPDDRQSVEEAVRTALQSTCTPTTSSLPHAPQGRQLPLVPRPRPGRMGRARPGGAFFRRHHRHRGPEARRGVHPGPAGRTAGHPRQRPDRHLDGAQPDRRQLQPPLRGAVRLRPSTSSRASSVRVILPQRRGFRGARAPGIRNSRRRRQLHFEEMELVRKDGSRFWCATSGRAIDPADPHAGSIWVFTDVTEQHDTLMALRESEARFRKLNEELEQRVRERTAELTRRQQGTGGLQLFRLARPGRAAARHRRLFAHDRGGLRAADRRARERDTSTAYACGTQRMQQLIDDMLALSRITRDEMKPGNRRPLRARRTGSSTI
jgi:PAS domain S-box-containing protein